MSIHRGAPRSRGSSNGHNSDGSMMNVNNRLGSRPSIKLFSQYNTGSAMSSLLYGSGPETAAPAPRLSAAERHREQYRREVTTTRIVPRGGTGASARNKSISPTVRRAAAASAGRRSPTPPGSPAQGRTGGRKQLEGEWSGASAYATSAAISSATSLMGAAQVSTGPPAAIVGKSPAEAQLSLWDAAKDGDFTGAKRAVEAGADVNGVNFREGGATALHYAARTGRVAYVSCREHALIETQTRTAPFPRAVLSAFRAAPLRPASPII